MKHVIPGTPPYHYEPTTPTLTAEPFTDGERELWRVWCDHCDEWHYHGPARGHRIAHCVGETPYTATGYNLSPRSVTRIGMDPDHE